MGATRSGVIDAQGDGVEVPRAAAPGPLTPALLVTGLVFAKEVRISPNGERILFALEEVVGTRRITQVWSCRRDGSDRRCLTPELGCTFGARWSPDGERIALVARSEQGWSVGVVSAEAATTETRWLVHHDRDISDLTWAPNGSGLAYCTDSAGDEELATAPSDTYRSTVRVTRRIDYKEDGRDYLGDRRSRVFVINMTGRVTRNIGDGRFDHRHPIWSPDGRHLVVQVVYPATGTGSLLLHELSTGEATPITPAEGVAESCAWAPDSRRLVYACDLTRSRHPDYFVYDASNGQTQQVSRDLPCTTAAALGDQAPPVWLDDRSVLINSVHAGASELQVLDVDSGQMTPTWRGDSRNAGLSVDTRRRYAVTGHESLTSAGEIAVFDPQENSHQVITHHNSGILRDQQVKCEIFSVQVDGFTIEAWVLLPPDFAATQRYPVILDVHGGPNSNYGYGFRVHQQYWTNHGFVVVYANPRGSTSYGGCFANAVVRDWGGGDFRDVMAALDRVLERPYADPDRVGIFGYSYGGYMTAWSISHTDRFQAAVCGAPIFNLTSDFGTSDVAYQGLEHFAGGAPNDEKEWYLAHSPSTFAHQTTPTLIVHGESDHRCPIGEGEEMFTALKKCGCATEFARYPGASHMFFENGDADQRIDFLTRTLGWFQQGLCPAGSPSAQGDSDATRS